jgi:hypothetical protein
MADNWNVFNMYDEKNLPEVDSDVFYFFEFTGVSKGQYYGGNCFGGNRGFLTGDVTHWQYDVGQEIPARPEGY